MTHEKKLILASASPRRKELLSDAQYIFECMSPDVDETIEEGENPGDAVIRLASSKALAVSEKHRGATVVGADTIVTIDGEIFGKPRDRADAKRMLHTLSGRTHQVWTGVAVAEKGKIARAFAEMTDVTFCALSDEEIVSFADSGEGDDKAGSYAIQGRGALLVERIDGCYSNVVGLPISRLSRVLNEMMEVEDVQ